MNKIRFGIIEIAFMMFCAHTLNAQQWIPKRIVGMDYPHIARGARIEGKVEVVCTLNPDGSVAFVKVTEGPNPILVRAVKENALKWTFMAGSITGQLPETITLVYTFKMEKKVSQPMDASASPNSPGRQFIYEYPSSIKINSEYCMLESSCY